MAAAAPLVLTAGGSVPGTIATWVVTGFASGLAGAYEFRSRTARMAATAPSPWEPSHWSGVDGAAAVRITGFPRERGGQRWAAPGVIAAWTGADDMSGLRRRPLIGDGIYLSGKGEPPSVGAILSGSISLGVPPAATLPGGFDLRRFLAGRRIRWTGRLGEHTEAAPAERLALFGARLLTAARSALIRRLRELLPDREATLAAGVLLGLRNSDSRRISTPFAALGLAHLFAVSGLHVGILLGLVLLPGRVLGLAPRTGAITLLVFIPLYILLTGAPGSVVRAGGMGLASALARPLGRRGEALRTLGLLYWSGSVLAPLQVLDTGVQLSYLAAGGILLASRATDGFRCAGPRPVRLIVAGLAVSGAAQWFTLPVVAGSFGQINLFSPLANLVAVPLFAAAVWGVVTALLLSVFSMSVAGQLGAVCWLILRGLAGGVVWLEGRSSGALTGLPVPGPLQITGWVLATLLLFGLIRLRKLPALTLAAGACLVAATLWLVGPGARSLATPGPGPCVWQFAVGQGDCGLLIMPDGWTALLDSGGRFGGPRSDAQSSPLAREIIPFLRRQGLGVVDACILSHGHRDHTGGAEALQRAVRVKRWLVAGRAQRAVPVAVDSAEVSRPTAGTVLHQTGPWSLTVEHPLPDQTAAARENTTENNRSLVVALRRAGQAVMVWSGDLELAGEAKLLAHGEGPGECEVWKAGHHGSDTSGSPEMLARLRPRLVLISCGVENSYGHPSHGPFLVGGDTVSTLRTDLEGSIRLRWPTAGPPVWRTYGARPRIGGLP